MKIQLSSEKENRNFMIYYINRKRSKAVKKSGNPNFFTWRIKTNDFTKQFQYIERLGFVVYKVYHKVESRASKQSFSTLVYTGTL